MDDKKNFENLIKKPHHRSIIFLLEQYQLQRDKNGNMKKVGLRPIHFKYALMENPEISDDNLKRIKKFFNNYEKNNFDYFFIKDTKNSLDFLYKKGIIKKGYVESAPKLSNYLNTLKENGIIDSKGKKPFIRYFLTDKFLLYRYKQDIIDKINRFSHFELKDERSVYEHLNKPEISPLKYESFSNYPEFVSNSNRSWFLFGFTDEMINKLNKEMKKKFSDCIGSIEENLMKIMEIKKTLNKRDYEKNINDVIKKGNFIEAVYNDNIMFHYNASFSIIPEERRKLVDSLFKDIKLNKK